MKRPRLVVFAKAPVIGGAKTRLAKGVGKIEAWRRHRAMTAQILRSVRDRRWATVLAVSPDRAVNGRFPGVWPPDLPRAGQGSGDLGARQARAFAAPPLTNSVSSTTAPPSPSLPLGGGPGWGARNPGSHGRVVDTPPRPSPRGEGGMSARPRPGTDLFCATARAVGVRRHLGPTVVIGTDAPQITRADIAAAFAALKRHDAVIGPAADGGYWLLGLARPAPAGLFDGVRWSHAQTRSDLEARLARCGLQKIAYLRALRDIDEAGDLAALRKDRRS